MEYDICEEYCKIIKAKLNISDFDGVILNAEKLIAYDKNCADGYYYLGLGNFALGHYADSVKDYEQCIELKKDHAKAYYNMGISKYYLQRYKEAVNLMKTALGIFAKLEDKDSCTKCRDSIDYITEEQDL